MSRDGEQRDMDAVFSELTAPLEREIASRADPISAFDAADAELDARGDGFVPPDPRIRVTPQALAPWIVLGLGLVAAAACLFLAPGPLRAVTGAVALVLVVTGAVLLLRRLPAEREDPEDTGARV